MTLSPPHNDTQVDLLVTTPISRGLVSGPSDDYFLPT